MFRPLCRSCLAVLALVILATAVPAQEETTADAEAAYDLAVRVANDTSRPLDERVQAAVDGASVSLAREQPRAALELLLPLLEVHGPTLPGEVYFLAGLAARAVNLRQRAREYFASVKPDDPAFVPAREQLGRIGLESGENELALRYFESAARRDGAGRHPELLAGRWRALHMLGRDVEAREVATVLLREHPTSLAALEVRQILRVEETELAVAADTVEVVVPDEPVESGTTVGRLAVELAVFRDRALALKFEARWQAEIPDLLIQGDRDSAGQPRYRVVTGSFVSRAQADTEVRRLSRTHGLQGVVVESDD